MTKRVAVVVGSRQAEALRMSIGLTLVDDVVDVYLADKTLERKGNELNIDTLKDLEIGLYSSCEESDDISFIPAEEMAKKLLTYDHILPY